MDEELDYLIQQIVHKQEELSNELDGFLNRMTQTRDEIDKAVRRASRAKSALNQDTARDNLTRLAERDADASWALIAYDDALSLVLDSLDASAAGALPFAGRVNSLSRRFDNLDDIAGSMDMK